MDHVVWSIVKKNHAFVCKNKHDNAQFSREKGNLVNRHQRKFSGFRSKAVGVEYKNGKVVLHKKRKPSQSVSGQWASRVLGRHNANHTNKAAVAIKAETSELPVSYRKDLTNLAVARYHKLHKLQTAEKAAAAAAASS